MTMLAAPAPAVEGEPPKKRRTCVCHDDCDAAGSGAVHVADQKPAGEPGEDHSQHDGCAWPDEPCNQRRRPAGEPHEMTLAEACTADDLAGKEVQILLADENEWQTFDADAEGWSPRVLARARYRLKPAPVLSRVQEMARAFAGGHASDGPCKAMTEAIRAVCEWLRDRPVAPAVTVDPGVRAKCKEVDAAMANDVEREFLGKGR